MKKRRNKLSIVEKIVFFLGILFITGLIGYLLYQSIYGKKTHADLKVFIEHQVERPLVFKVIVKNEGGKTAEEVLMNFVLYENGRKSATTSASVNYVPISSEVKLWVMFNDQKTCDSLVVSSITFREP